MSFSVWHILVTLKIFKIDTKRIFLKYLFPDLEIGPLIFMDLPDCFIEGSNPQ